MTGKALREEAAKRYENGESAKKVYESLGKSKRWFFKWIKRYRSGEKNWADDRSRRPHHIPKRIDGKMESAVIETREKLEKELYAQIGALNISWHLEQKGLSAPPMSTINKILKRNKLVRKRIKYQSKGVDYPAPPVKRSNDVHQLDGVGPRYLRDDGRFYSMNIIDVYDRRCNVNPMRRKRKMDVTKAIIRSWQTLGIPCYLQMDNILAARGSNKYPHSFGMVIRLCLHVGIQPVFIPAREPWRNGIIERFQDVFDKVFFRAQFFPSFNHVQKEAKVFELFHNQKHRYSTLGGKTPVEKFSGDIKLLSKDFKIPDKLTIEPGYVHLIRFIRSNLILDVFGEKFPLPRNSEYEYVWATIDTANDILRITHDSQIITEFDYSLPKTFMDLSEIEL